MPPPQSLPWVEPLQLAASLQDNPLLAGADWVLLYSGTRTSYSGRFSYLACRPVETIRAADFTLLASKLSHGREWFENAWFGYLGYGLKNALEDLIIDQPNWIHMPELMMIRFETIIRFDHDQKRIEIYGNPDLPPVTAVAVAEENVIPACGPIASNMSKTAYLSYVSDILRRIHEGEFYQANLTRKFQGEFAAQPDPFALFRKLCRVSPAAYSAFLKLGDVCVLSSSPEQFMAVDSAGNMQTRPIKGTAPRHDDPVLDQQSRQQLAASTKDQAENLMIVDLMRNDFSRSCLPGSVRTPSLFDITSHATIHHLSSTVTGIKRPDCSTIEAVARCFPPGSMTGAPKIRAMTACSEYERVERGIYSGAIGWFGGDGSCELSVVIRTLIRKGQRFEFQVGGGIVADSSPELEWMETIDKAKGILKVLNLPPSALGN